MPYTKTIPQLGIQADPVLPSDVMALSQDSLAAVTKRVTIAQLAAYIGAGASPLAALGIFTSVASAQAAQIAVATRTSGLILLGYYSSGDGGAAQYKYSASMPAHPGRFQSADGAWWAIAEIELNFEQFGAKGDGVTNDGAALNNCFSCARAISATVQGAQRVYRTTVTIDAIGTGNGCPRFTGAGCAGSPGATAPTLISTTIVQATDNIAILRTGLKAYIDGLTLIYANQQVAASTSAIGLELNALSASEIRNVTVYNAAISFGIPQVAWSGTNPTPGVNVIFNNVFENLNSYKASLTHYDLRAFGAAGCTNTTLIKPYMNGGRAIGWGSGVQACSYGIRAHFWDGLNLVNPRIDGCDFSVRAYDLIGVYTDLGLMQFEESRVTADGGEWIRTDGSCKGVTYEGMSFYNCRSQVATSQFILSMNSGRAATGIWTNVTGGPIYIDGALSSYTTPSYRSLYVGADGASPLDPVATNIRMGRTVDTFGVIANAWSNGVTYNFSPVRMFDGATVTEVVRRGVFGGVNRIIYTRTSGDPSNTIPPTAGAWTVGDVQNIPDAPIGFPTKYRCITAGTPGTWRPAEWTPGRGVTGSRPTLPASAVGVQYFDTTIDADGVAIWWNGTAWVDATGAVV